jgi:hypothetical protein
MSIEKNFDIPFVADLALREKQIQQTTVRSSLYINGLPGGLVHSFGPLFFPGLLRVR